MSELSVEYVVSVLTPDRNGIVADVTEAIYGLGGNLLATSQTIMQGWFTMLIGAAFPREVSGEAIERAVKAAGDFDVSVHEVLKEPPPAPRGEPYIVTSIGKDRPGIVRSLSRCCADRGVNIDDVWNKIRDGDFVNIFHVTMPPDVDPKDFRFDLEKAAKTFGISLTLQHQDIFTATNALDTPSRRFHVSDGRHS